MAYQDQFYTTGTVSVTNNSATVTGAGTGWQTALIQGGVLYVRGGAYPILTVDSETKITLAVPYTGTNGSGVVYAVDRQRSAATSAVAMNDRLAQIIHEIRVGNIEQLNALDLKPRQLLQTDANGILKAVNLAAKKLLRTDEDGDLSLSDLTSAIASLLTLAPAANQLAYFDTRNSAALTSLTALARSVLGSASGSAMWSAMGATGSISNPGWMTFPNGFKLQWGNTSNTATNGVATIMYPSAFTTFAVPLFVNGDTNGYGYAPMGFRVGTNGQFTTYFPGGITGGVRICWIAVGQ